MTGKTAEETEGDKAGRKGDSDSVAATGPRGITSEEPKLPLAGDAAPSPGGGTKIPYTTHHHRLPPQKVRRL